MRLSGIYKIQSLIKPDRIYIGSAVDIYRRWNDHLRDLHNNKHHSKKLQRHFFKYGEADLVFSILLECPKEGLIKSEQHFIDFYSAYFNICKVAGSHLGMKRSKATKKKMREWQLGRIFTQAHKDKIGVKSKNRIPWNKGKKASRQACINQSKSHIGQIAWNKGIKMKNR